MNKIEDFGKAKTEDVIRWLNKRGYKSLAKSLEITDKQIKLTNTTNKELFRGITN